MRAHTVILGAGATIAAIPNGDKNGKKSSVMKGMISRLGLEDLLEEVEIDTKSDNIEDIYSELYMKPEYIGIVKELERSLYDYFDSFDEVEDNDYEETPTTPAKNESPACLAGTQCPSRKRKTPDSCSSGLGRLPP